MTSDLTPPSLGSTERELWSQRIQKIQTLSELGVKPYASSYEVTLETTELPPVESLPSLEEALEGDFSVVRMAGRQVLWREHGRMCFGQILQWGIRLQYATVRDYTQVQGFSEQEEWTAQQVYRRLFDLGDYLGLEGTLCQTKKGELTLLVREITLLSKSLRPLPAKHEGLQDLDTRQRERQLDMVSDSETLQRFLARSRMVRAIRGIMDDSGFFEVETSTLQPQAGGAMAQPFMTHHHALDHDFSLRIAIEIELKMSASGGIERVYEIGRCYRNEGIDPSHLQEFSMLEWYAAYMSFEQNIELCIELLRASAQALNGSLEAQVYDPLGSLASIDLAPELPRVRFPDLLREHAGVDFHEDSLETLQQKARELGVQGIETKARHTLLDDIYKKTARPKLISPTVVLDYPSALKPLATPREDGTAECFQIVIAGWEVVNSYGELIDPQVQRALLQDQAAAKEAGDLEAMPLDERFLKAMEHGFPPMAGSGMGIDRLATLLLGLQNIREGVLFPTMKPLSEGSRSEDD